MSPDPPTSELPSREQILAVPAFQLEPLGDAPRDEAARSDFVLNVLKIYRVLRGIGWPSDIVSIPPPFAEIRGGGAEVVDEVGDKSSFVVHAAEGTLTSQPWFDVLTKKLQRFGETRDVARSCGQLSSAPGLDPVACNLLEKEVRRADLPPLTLLQGKYRRVSRKTKVVREEEMRRLALSYIYGRALPSEAVAAVPVGHPTELDVLMAAYLKVIKIFVTADVFQEQHGSKARLSVVGQVVTIRNELRKLEKRKLDEAANRNVARRMEQSSDTASPRTIGAEAACDIPPPTEALENARKAVSRTCLQLGYDPDKAIEDPKAFLRWLDSQEDGAPSRE